MPHYFFHLIERELVEDYEGVELPSLDAAREEAMRSAREILSQRVLNGEPLTKGGFRICDERGEEVLLYPFQLALRE